MFLAHVFQAAHFLLILCANQRSVWLNDAQCSFYSLGGFARNLDLCYRTQVTVKYLSCRMHQNGLRFHNEIPKSPFCFRLALVF